LLSNYKGLDEERARNTLKKFIRGMNLDMALTSEITDEVQESLVQLRAAKVEYLANRDRKWIVLAIGLFIGLVLGIEIPKLANKLSHSSYSRDSLDNIMTTLLGDYNINESLSDEVLIVAYDYNSQEPRFFSKYFSNLDPLIYDVPVGNATGASSAAPTFFDPKVNTDGYGFVEMQIDGGIICNNPALYAYEMAKNFHNQ
jgi:predicted acylesterase/phospholipase RssA